VRLAADGRFVAGRIHAVRQLAPGGPHLDPAAKILPIVRELSRVDFGDRAVRIGDDGALTAP